MSQSLEYRAVTRRFGNRLAVDRLSLRCAPGSATCLVGPNGAGKSTALSLAAGLLPVSTGEVLYRGLQVTPTSPPPHLGYLAQRSVFPQVLTVAEILELALAARGAGTETRRQARSLTGLEEVAELRVGSLSSGWVRRLGLALALIPPTDLLLLDEPFVGLDLATLDKTLAVLTERVAAGTTVVLSSHDFAVIDRLGPRMVVLEEGSLHLAQEVVEGKSREIYESALSPDPRPAQENPRAEDRAG